MANTVAECDAIIAACKAAGVQLSIGYRLHYEPHNLEFMRIAREKEFGPLLHLQGANGFRMGSEAAAYSAWRLDKKLAGGGRVDGHGRICDPGRLHGEGGGAAGGVDGEV